MRCRANKRRLFFLNRFQFSPTKPEKFVSNHRLLVNINVAINQLYWTGRIILKWFRKISVEKITSRLQIWFWTTFFKDFLYISFWNIFLHFRSLIWFQDLMPTTVKLASFWLCGERLINQWCIGPLHAFTNVREKWTSYSHFRHRKDFLAQYSSNTLVNTMFLMKKEIDF